MFNKELLLASQEVIDPYDFMRKSWFEIVLQGSTTRAIGSNIFLLSFYTPNGLALDAYPVERSGSDTIFVPVEYFKNIPFELSEMVGYEYSNLNESMNEDVYIKFEEVNSDLVPYNNVRINFNPGALYLFEGEYYYYS